MVTKKEKKHIAVVVVAILVVAAVVAAFTLGSGTEDNEGKYTIKASVNRDCTGTPFYVGTDIGYFEANDINLVDTGATDYSTLTSLLISGQNDIYTGHPVTLVNLLSAGVKVKGVIMTGYEPDDAENNLDKIHMHWLSRSNSGIEKIEDLQNLGHKPKIGTLSFGVCADLETKILLKEKLNWVAGEDYELVKLSDALQVQDITGPYKDGSIDLAVLHPPFYTAAEATEKVNVVATSYDAFGQYGGVSLLVFTEKFIQENPDSVRAFTKAFKDAERWSNDHREEAGKLTQDTIGLDAAAAHYYSYSGVITDADIQFWIDAMKEVNDPALEDFKKLYGREIQPSDVYTTEFNDLWVEPTSPQPLNPFNSETNKKYGWVDKTDALIESNNFVADLKSTIDKDIVDHYGATINTVQPLTVRPW